MVKYLSDDNSNRSAAIAAKKSLSILLLQERDGYTTASNS